MQQKRKSLLAIIILVPLVALLIQIISYACITYQVSFYDWDNTLLETQTVNYRQTVILPDDPSREGYTFTGWDNPDALTAPVKSDMIFTAQYDINYYDVKFLDWDDKSLCQQSVAYDSVPFLPQNPSRTGYQFIGWDTEITPIHSDTVFTAQYEICQYEIVFQNWDGTELSHELYDYNTTVTPPKATRPADNAYTYQFTGWSEEITPATENKTYIAQYKAIPIVCSYCNSPNHKTSVCPVKATDNGAVGRWVISSQNINVACYESMEQSVCDAKDSACYFKLGSQMVIADHWNQGFDGIKKCQPGTTAYMETENGRQNYVCTKIFKGHNTGGLTDEEYNPIDDWNPGGITCYTCNGNWRNIVIVFFQPCD